MKKLSLSVIELTAKFNSETDETLRSTIGTQLEAAKVAENAAKAQLDAYRKTLKSLGVVGGSNSGLTSKVMSVILNKEIDAVTMLSVPILQGFVSETNKALKGCDCSIVAIRHDAAKEVNGQTQNGKLIGTLQVMKSGTKITSFEVKFAPEKVTGNELIYQFSCANLGQTVQAIPVKISFSANEINTYKGCWVEQITEI